MTNSEAKKVFTDKKITSLDFNNGLHMRIVLSQYGIDGHIDFWPTREKWIYGEKSDSGIYALVQFIEDMKNLDTAAKQKGMKYLTPTQLFDIVKKSKRTNLFDIIETIHKAIYK